MSDYVFQMTGAFTLGVLSTLVFIYWVGPVIRDTYQDIIKECKRETSNH